MKRLLCTLFLLASLLCPGLRPQTPGFYDTGTLRTISLTFKQVNWWTQLTANYSTKTYLRADLMVDNRLYQDVGVRFKGNISYNGTGTSQKKPFKIKLDAFVPNQDVYGFDSLNLNNGYLDPTFCREVLCYNLYRKYTAGPKANFVKLVINNQNWGIYINIQQVDKDFLSDWFTDDGGNRYKGDAPSNHGPVDGTCLTWLGTGSSQYQLSYELKSTVGPTTWTDLIQVCNVLNNTPTASLMTELPKVLAVDRAIWHLALHNIFVNLDSYVGAGHNFYLYQDPTHGRMNIIPWDLNECIGTYHMGMTIANLEVLSPFYQEFNSGRPLIRNLLAQPQWRERYIAHLRTMIAEFFSWNQVGPLVTNYQNLIKNEVQADTKKLYSFADFTTNVTQDVKLLPASSSNDVPGLKSFITARRAYILSLSEFKRTVPTLTGLTRSPQDPTHFDTIWLTVKATGPVGVVTLHYRSQGYFRSLVMFDDGQHHDGLANDGIFGVGLPPQAANTRIEYYCSVAGTTAAGNAVSFLPTKAAHQPEICTVKRGATGNSVRINEFLAKNVTGKKDEMNEFEDWLELYNPTATTINVGWMYLSDDPLRPTKWQIPYGYSLKPGATMLIWADEDANDGPLHANFKLSMLGEEIFLYSADGKTLLDTIKYGLQQADVSTGLLFDGTGSYVTFPKPSPDLPNAPGTGGSRVFSALDPTAHTLALNLFGAPGINSSPVLQFRNGVANSSFVNIMSTGTGNLPLAGGMTLFMGYLPPAMLFSAIVPGNAFGSADLTLPIPNIPALIGQPFYMQAFGAAGANLLISNGLELIFQ